MARQNAAPEVSEIPEPTAIERSIVKFENRLVGVKHIDAKDLGLNFIFPLLRKLAQTAGDHEEQIISVIDAVENIEAGGDTETFAAARDVISKLAKLLDETMVAAGFYTVEIGGLKDTGKAPASIRQAYAEIGGDVREVVTAIQEAIAFDDEDGDDEDGDDEAGDEGDNGADDEDEIGSDGDSSESAAAGSARAAAAAASTTLNNTAVVSDALATPASTGPQEGGTTDAA